jgi:hypothetical protein
MELWKFGGNELKMYILELLNNITDKNQMTQYTQNDTHNNSFSPSADGCL